jgi:hypothetical protein
MFTGVKVKADWMACSQAWRRKRPALMNGRFAKGGYLPFKLPIDSKAGYLLSRYCCRLSILELTVHLIFPDIGMPQPFCCAIKHLVIKNLQDNCEHPCIFLIISRDWIVNSISFILIQVHFVPFRSDSFRSVPFHFTLFHFIEFHRVLIQFRFLNFLFSDSFLAGLWLQERCLWYLSHHDRRCREHWRALLPQRCQKRPQFRGLWCRLHKRVDHSQQGILHHPRQPRQRPLELLCPGFDLPGTPPYCSIKSQEGSSDLRICVPRN